MSIFENYKNLGKIKQGSSEYEYPLEGIEESRQDSEESEKDNEPFNFNVYALICISFSVILIGQLLRLQIAKGFQHQLLAEENRIRSEEIKAPRGIIFDKNKNPLVKNTPRYQFVVFPIDLPKEKSQRIDIYEQIKTVTSIDLEEPISEIEKKLYSQDLVILKDNLERDEALFFELKFNDIPGVRTIAQPVRRYLEIPGLSHVIGYTGKITETELNEHVEYDLTDILGKNGLELAYEEVLRGKKGARQIEVDAQGRVQRELATKEAVPGYNLITTIDSNLQTKTASALENKIKELNIASGVVIVQDPQTGGILTMVSYPSYNNNLFSRGITPEEYQVLLDDLDKPMLNRAISGTYPSGSVIKPVIAAAGLDQGVITENTTINDPGEIKIGDWVFPDWKNHGLVDVRKAIAESCNVFFYAVGGGWDKIRGLGVELIDRYLDQFGFGKKTNIEISGEAEGIIPSPEWKEKIKNEPWYLGDTYHLSIGQGDFLVTPLQLVNAVSAIANGGKLLKPHLASEVISQKGDIINKFEKEILNENLVNNQYSLTVVREGMRQAVTDGSARQLQSLPVSSAGKTGTAQFTGSQDKTHAWFTGFAPYENPEISIVVLVEQGGGGEVAAEPIAKEILQYYFENKKTN